MLYFWYKWQIRYRARRFRGASAYRNLSLLVDKLKPRQVEFLLEIREGFGAGPSEIVENKLRKLADHCSFENLVKLLAVGSVRSSAIAALGKSGDPRAFEVLAKIVDPWDPDGGAAIKALANSGDPRVFDLLVSQMSGGRLGAAAAEALGQLGDTRAVDPLVRALKCNDSWLSSAAANSLKRLGDARAVEGIIEALNDRGDDLPDAAIETLGNLGDKRAVEPLIRLAIGTGKLRQHAIRALGELGDTRSVEPLILALRQREYSAISPLGRLGDARAVEPLIDAMVYLDLGTPESLGRINGYARQMGRDLGDYSRSPCKEAAEALAQLGDARAIGPLIDRMFSLAPGIPVAAAKALEALGKKQFLEILRSTGGLIRDGYYDRLATCGHPRAVERLTGALGWRQDELRSAAARAIEKLADMRLVDSLVQLLEDKNSDAASAAATILGNLGVKDALEPLIASYFRGNEAAAGAIIKLGERRAIELLKRDTRRRSECDGIGICVGLGDTDSIKHVYANPKAYVNHIDAALRSAPELASGDQLLSIESLEDEFVETSEMVDSTPGSTGDHEHHEVRTRHRISYDRLRRMAKEERLRRSAANTG